MKKKKCLLIKFLILLLIQNGTCSVTIQTAWKPMAINGSIFEDPSIQNQKIFTSSDIKCALMATRMKWPQVLYFNNGVCNLADANLTNCHNVVMEGPSAVDGLWANSHEGKIG